MVELLSTVVFNTKNDFWPGQVRECLLKIESTYKDPHLERIHLVTIKDKRNKLRFIPCLAIYRPKVQLKSASFK